MEFYKYSYYLLFKYIVMFYIVFTVKGICVLFLVLSIFFSWYISRETAFYYSHRLCGLFGHAHAVVLSKRKKKKQQIHTVKKITLLCCI